MNVYVESNFVLEQALEQEQCESCEELVRIAAAGSIRLMVPAFSLAESQSTLMRRARAGRQLLDQLQLGRSRAYREAPGSLSELTALLTKSEVRERERLEQTLDAVLVDKTADAIPLDSEVLYRAYAIQVGLGMSPQDSIVLASIVLHLEQTKPAQSCFLNRNTKDFDNPDVRDLLDGFGCKFFGTFDAGLQYVKACLRKAGQ